MLINLNKTFSIYLSVLGSFCMVKQETIFKKHINWQVGNLPELENRLDTWTIRWYNCSKRKRNRTISNKQNYNVLCTLLHKYWHTLFLYFDIILLPFKVQQWLKKNKCSVFQLSYMISMFLHCIEYPFSAICIGYLISDKSKCIVSKIN